MKNLLSIPVFILLCLGVAVGGRTYYQLDANTYIATPNDVNHSQLRKNFSDMAGVVRKFGYNPDIDTGQTEDTWSAGGLFPGLQTGALCSLRSSSNADSVGNTGALTVAIFGLDSLFVERSDTVTLKGVNRVPIGTGGSTKYSIFHRMEVLTAGAGGINAGTLTASINSVDMAQVAIGDGQTQLAAYCVPSGKTLYLTRWYFKPGKNSGSAYCVGELRMQKYGGVLLVRDILPVSVASEGESNDNIALYVPEKTLIVVRIRTLSANNIGVAGGFSGMLYNN